MRSRVASVVGALLLVGLLAAPAGAASPTRISFSCTYEPVQPLADGDWWGHGGVGGGASHVRDNVWVWSTVGIADPVCGGEMILTVDYDLAGATGLTNWAGVVRLDIHLALPAYEGGFDFGGIAHFRPGPDYYSIGTFVGRGFGIFDGAQYRAVGYRGSDWTDPDNPREFLRLTGEVFVPGD